MTSVKSQDQEKEQEQKQEQEQDQEEEQEKEKVQNEDQESIISSLLSDTEPEGHSPRYPPNVPLVEIQQILAQLEPPQFILQQVKWGHKNPECTRNPKDFCPKLEVEY